MKSRSYQIAGFSGCIGSFSARLKNMFAVVPENVIVFDRGGATDIKALKAISIDKFTVPPPMPPAAAITKVTDKIDKHIASVVEVKPGTN